MDPTDLEGVKHLLSPQRALHPHEHATAQRAFHSLDAKLDTIDRRIESLQLEMAQLQGQKKVVEDQRRQFSELLSDYQPLPPEIIQMVMEILWREAVYPDGDHRVARHTSPIPRLMLVSSDWHRIARDTAYFWASRWISIFNIPQEEVERVVETTEWWFSRAHDHALNLTIELFDGDSVNAPLIAFLHKWAPQIGNLCVDLTETSGWRRTQTDSILHGFSLLGNVAWPRLHTLTVEGHTLAQWQHEEEHRGRDLESLTRFPALRSIHMLSRSKAVVGAIYARWDRLTFLSIGVDLLDHDLLHTLRKCSSSLTGFQLLFIQSTAFAKIPPIDFPRLARLSIHLTDVTHKPILDHFTLPALRTIALHHLDTITTVMAWRDRLTQFFHALRPGLRYVYLEVTYSTPMSISLIIPEIFEEAPNSECVEISVGMDLDHIPQSTQWLIVPLTYGAQEDDTGEICGHLEGIVRSRWNMGYPVKVMLEVGEGTG